MKLTLKTRRLIAAGFIISFFIIAPLLILYTAGYRYHFKKQKVAAVGALVLETEPKNVNIKINNKEQKQSIPARFVNLAPNDYQIEITKEGYYPWQKNLTVKNQETTFAEEIILFKKTDPIQVLNEENIQQGFISPNKNYLLFLNNQENTLKVLDFKNNKTVSIINFKNTKENFEQAYWSKNSRDLVLKTDQNYYFLSLNQLTNTRNLAKEFKLTEINNVKWDNNSENILYFQSKNKIYKAEFGLNSYFHINEIFELTQKEENILDFFYFNNEVYLLVKNANKTFLKKYALNEPSKISGQVELANKNFYFDNIYNYKIAVKEKNTYKTFFFNLDLNKLLFEKNNSQNLSLNHETNTLLLNNNLEINLINLSNTELTEKTITRYSNNLKKVTWYPEPNYLILNQDKKLHILELDEREKHNIITLPTEEINDFWLDKNGENIFYLTSSGIWKIEIID